MTNPIITDVFHCARCDGDHLQLKFNPLTRPVQGGAEQTHWAECPTNGEPILMSVEEDYYSDSTNLRKY